MRYQPKSEPRKGMIVPLIAVCSIGLLAFVALAIDLGLMMIARTQCQDAADAAAMAGARTLNGDAANNNNYGQVGPNATAAATAHSVLSQPLTSANVSVTVGDYYYDTSSASFKINATARQTGDNWTLAQATVTYQGNFFFAQVFGLSGFNTSALATAAHRPRDVCIIQDFSGSMRFDSLLGTPHGGMRTASMNADPNYPQWGHYLNNASMITYQGDVQASSGEIQGACNDTATTTDGNPVIGGFYGDSTAFGTSVPAFTSAGSTYNTTPGGDAPQFANQNNSSSSYATCVKDITGSTTRDANWELDGYAAYPTSNLNNKTDYSSQPFNGYTQGPGYWGKTFFLWPPDPRQPPSYYRNSTVVQQFLVDILGSSGSSGSAIEGIYKANSTTGSNNWTSWPDAATLGTYLTNKVGLTAGASSQKYERILRLFSLAGSGALNKAVAAGMPANGSGAGVAADWRARISYLPDGVTPLNVNDGTSGGSSVGLWSGGTFVEPSSGGTRYLVNYDAILDWIKNCGPNPFPSQLRAGGVVYYTSIPSHIDTSTFPPADPNQRFWKEYIDEVLGIQQTGGSGTSPSYWCNVGYTGYGSDFNWGTVQTSGVPTYTTYMSYTDNPQRPLLHFWFGPMSLIDFMGNYNMGRFWWPGTVTEAPTFQTKLGVQGALMDMQTNHPNDNVALIFFSSPRSSATSGGYYNYARAPLGKNYVQMVNSQWFSPKVISTNAEISVYDSNGNLTTDIADVPRANGGTCYAMPLMLAYNQFSSNTTLASFTKKAAAGTAGGLGRNGSSKLIIFETDGMVNTGCSASLVSGSGGTGYYKVRIADANDYTAAGTEFPTSVGGVSFSTGATQSTTIATQIVTDFSTARKPVLIHCIAFGSLFNPSNSSSYKTNALQNLANLEVIGSVQTGSPTSLASNKIIVGDFNTRISLLTSAFNRIMEDGVQVTLISAGSGKP
jgi:Flp pilus assembly protein TadG